MEDQRWEDFQQMEASQQGRLWWLVTTSSCRVSFKPALPRCFFDEDVSVPSWDMKLLCFVCSTPVGGFFFCHCWANQHSQGRIIKPSLRESTSCAPPQTAIECSDVQQRRVKNFHWALTFRCHPYRLTGKRDINSWLSPKTQPLKRSGLYGLFDLRNTEDVHDGAGFSPHRSSSRVCLFSPLHFLDWLPFSCNNLGFLVFTHSCR